MSAHNQDKNTSESVQLFLSTISSTLHDARKYALINQGFAELLQREVAGPLNEHQKELVQEMIHRTKMLFHVLDQSLMLSSIDLYPREIEPDEYSVEEIIQEALERAIHVNKPKSETLHIEKAIASFRVFIDRDDIVHALRQVIDNAIKYTKTPGKIAINTTIHEEMIIIEIKDTGVGIPQDIKERLFQRLSSYYQHLPDELSSSGVGLAIAQVFIQRNNGRIKLTQTSSEGSTFTIALPQHYAGV